ncbi:MAG: 2Fe-2S iron-sulfur cluster binding domain-containing protein, partial [Spirochaetes bacterium]|nr:2Fe-2S iron-sulfur cluster binding domain-containing protein [Spirochaetota bacterium]
MQGLDLHAITVRADGVRFQLTSQAGRSVLAVLAASSRVFVPAACGGRGTCGKCVVRGTATGGTTVPISEEDRRALSQEQLAEGLRLACRLPSTAVAAVEIIATSDAAFTKAEIPDISIS